MSTEDNSPDAPEKPETGAEAEQPEFRVVIVAESDRDKEICQLYWQHNDEMKFFPAVTEIARQFGIKSTDLTQIIKTFSYAYSTDDICARCKEPKPYRTRSAVTPYRYPDAKCRKCIEEEKLLEYERQQLALQQMRLAIRESYKPTVHALDISDFSLETSVYLLSFIRATASEDLTYFKSIAEIDCPLSPRYFYSARILQHLYEAKLIVVDPESRLDAFSLQNDIWTFHPLKVRWLLPVADRPERTRQIVTTLEGIFRSRKWPDAWYRETAALWKKVSFEECLQYLVFIMEGFKLPCPTGAKTELALYSALEHYSASQVYRMIHSAARGALDYYTSKNPKASVAGNSVVGGIQRYLEKALAEKWPVNPYGRCWDLPQSIISQVLFNGVLQITNRGFTEIPGSIDFANMHADANFQPVEDLPEEEIERSPEIPLFNPLTEDPAPPDNGMDQDESDEDDHTGDEYS